MPAHDFPRGKGLSLEDLSSRLTFAYKFVLPALWIGVFALVTCLMFVSVDAALREARWLFLGATLLGSAVWYWAGMRIKRVSLTGREFVISNYRRTIRVPFHAVERASSSVLMNPELIWLHFRRPTEFGSRIVFMPRQRFLGRYARHPLAQRLNDLLGSADAR